MRHTSSAPKIRTAPPTNSGPTTLFYRKNSKGDHLEQWCHNSGCRRWFNVRRDTVTYEIKQVYGIGETLARGQR